MFKQLFRRFSAGKQKLNRTCQSYRPGMECLEDRCVPAGNLASTLLSPNFLLLAGDDLGNQIQIKGGNVAGEFTVQGVQGTTVDGAKKQSFSGIERISLVLGAGDDSVKITDLTLANVNATGTLALSGILVRAGAGNDDVRIVNMSVHSDGQGATFDAQAFITVEGDIGGQGGDDNVRISNATVEATGASRTFAQIDVFGDIGTTTGGNDTAIVHNAFVRAHGGSTSNSAVIDLQELTGGGNDYYVVSNSHVFATGPDPSSRVTLEMGNGDDTGIVKNSTFDRLQARLGAGIDKLELRNNDIGNRASVDGGDDDDTLIAKNNTGTIIDVNFEN